MAKEEGGRTLISLRRRNTKGDKSPPPLPPIFPCMPKVLRANKQHERPFSYDLRRSRRRHRISHHFIYTIFPDFWLPPQRGKSFFPISLSFYFSSRYGKEVLRDREGDAITFPPLFSAYPPHPFPRAGHRHICVVYVQTSLCVIATIFARTRLRRPPAQIRIRKKEQEGKCHAYISPSLRSTLGFSTPAKERRKIYLGLFSCYCELKEKLLWVYD